MDRHPAPAARPLPVSAKRGREQYEVRIVLRAGIGAGRRRGNHGRTGGPLRHAGEPGRAAAHPHQAVGTQARWGSPSKSGSQFYHRRYAKPQSPAWRRRVPGFTRPLAHRLEDRHFLGLSRRMVRGYRRALHSGGLDRRLRSPGQSELRRSRCSRPAFLPHCRCPESPEARTKSSSSRWSRRQG